MSDTDIMHDGTESPDDVAARLHLLREWTGRNQRAFADLTGVTPAEWNVYERGRRTLPLNVALKLVRQWQVSLDWVYRGDRSGLSVVINRSLPHLRPGAKQA